MGTTEIHDLFSADDMSMEVLFQVVAVLWLRNRLIIRPDLDSDDPADIKVGREWTKKVQALHTLIDSPILVQKAWNECVGGREQPGGAIGNQ